MVVCFVLDPDCLKFLTSDLTENREDILLIFSDGLKLGGVS